VDYYLDKGVTITAKYYIALLGKLKQQLISKRGGKLSKGMLSSQGTRNRQIFTLKF
jgi:hypothetical protein